MVTTELSLQNLTTINDPTTFINPLSKHKNFLYFASFCIVVLSIFGMCGNLLTIVAIVKSPRVRSATAIFIVSLSLVDLFYYVISLPFSASDYIFHRWIYSDALCVFYPFIQYYISGMSLFLVTAISMNRYILIGHQDLYMKIYKKPYIAVMISVIMLFTFIMLLPTLLGVWGRFGYDKRLLSCTVLEVNDRSSQTFLLTLGFVVPCVAIVVCYVRIFWLIRNNFNRIKTPSNVETTDKKTEKRDDEWRVTRMILVIFCCFVLCYLPNTIVKVTDKEKEYPILHVLAYILVYASASINPIIYGVTNKQYRQAYQNVLTCRRPPRQSFIGISNDPTIHKSSYPH
ncbi:G-protein coupled receptor moody-like [Tachypleus tridentatus]|uniref:G-protein coupled receptor moody-like n=1 Tax=Tachypleus tridentatus TaxID=6853 RepID=UPI003FD0A620